MSHTPCFITRFVLHSEKRFDFGSGLESTHYANQEKPYPLLSAIHEPSAAQVAEKEAAQQRKALGLDLRRTEDRIAWLRHQVERAEIPVCVELGGRDLNAKMQLGNRGRLCSHLLTAHGPGSASAIGPLRLFSKHPSLAGDVI